MEYYRAQRESGTAPIAEKAPAKAVKAG
jgi:hypothetical protein